MSSVSLWSLKLRVVRLGGVHARRVHFPLMIQQLLGVKLLVVVLGGVGRLWSVFELRRVPLVQVIDLALVL